MNSGSPEDTFKQGQNVNQTFQERTHEGGFNWKLVSEYDPQTVYSSQDTEAMNEIMSDFLSAAFNDADMSIIMNPTVYKLIQHLQIIVNHLYSTQLELSRSNKRLIAKNKEYKEDAERKRGRIRQLYNTCKDLKNSAKCPICRKILKSQYYLDKHMKRRHSSVFAQWRSLRTGEIQRETKINDEVKTELLQIKDMISKQNDTMNKAKTVKENNDNEVQEVLPSNVNPFSTQRRPTPTDDFIEEINENKARSAPLKPEDYGEPPQQQEQQKSRRETSSDSSDSLNDVITIGPRKPEKVPDQVRTKAKDFITRKNDTTELDKNITVIRRKISEEMNRQSQIVKTQNAKANKEEVRKMLKVDMKYIHPTQKKGTINNFVELRKAPKKYVPTIKELDFSENSSVATYSSVEFVPESSTSTKSQSKTIDSGSAVVKPAETDKKEESSSSKKDVPNSEKKEESKQDKDENSSSSSSSKDKSDSNKQEKSEKNEEPKEDNKELSKSEKKEEPKEDNKDEEKEVSKSEKKEVSKSEKKEEKEVSKSEKKDEPKEENKDEEKEVSKSEKKEVSKSEKKEVPKPKKKETKYDDDYYYSDYYDYSDVVEKPKKETSKSASKKETSKSASKKGEQKKDTSTKKGKNYAESDYDYYYYSDEEPPPKKQPKKNDKNNSTKNKSKPKPKPRYESDDYYYYDDDYEDDPPKKETKKPKPSAKQQKEESESFQIEDTTKPKGKPKRKENLSDSSSFQIEDTTKPKGKGKASKKDSSSETSSFQIVDTTKSKPKSTKAKPKQKAAKKSDSYDFSDIDSLLND